MKKLRPRLTYSNVVSTLRLFLLVGGGTALAAGKLGKNSVGTKQIKANAVTTAKLKKNAVTGAKIKEGSVDGSKIADGSVTGADINAPSTSFSQVVARLRETTPAPFEAGKTYASLSYTQNAGEDNQVLGAMDVNFSAGCEAPRQAEALLLEDAGNPPVPSATNLVGIGVIEDKGSGSVTQRLDFAPFPGSYVPASRLAPAHSTGHTFAVVPATLNCASGSGATITGAGVDVIGTK